MEKILWNDSFSVGVSAFDQQHQQIISIINLLIDEPDEGFDPKSVAKLLNELTKYVHIHFHAEEELLTQHNYPELSMQQSEHKGFKHELADYCMISMEDHKSIPISILLYLKEWWIDHILVKDMKYRQFLTERGVS